MSDDAADSEPSAIDLACLTLDEIELYSCTAKSDEEEIQDIGDLDIEELGFDMRSPVLFDLLSDVPTLGGYSRTTGAPKASGSAHSKSVDVNFDCVDFGFQVLNGL